MSEARSHKLRVAVLLDGRPGHEKQTRGILQAMQSMAEVEVFRILVNREQPLFDTLRSLILLWSGKVPAHPALPEAAGLDLVLGTGSRTHLPLLALKRRYRVPAFTCMTPSFYLRGRFDLCFVPAHDGLAEGGNIMLTSGAPNCSINRGKHRDDRGLILLGGIDEKSHRWDSKEICTMIEQIIAKDNNIAWTISSSPRTPQDTMQLLGRLAAEAGNAAFFHYQDTEPGWIEEQYDRSGTVWVTADSISMMYEALTAGCRVGILPVAWKRAHSKFRNNEEYLVGRGMVTSYPSWVRGEGSWRTDINLNEARRCAERILQWFPDSLR